MTTRQGSQVELDTGTHPQLLESLSGPGSMRTGMTLFEAEATHGFMWL